jgi:hypothetical protein
MHCLLYSRERRIMFQVWDLWGTHIMKSWKAVVAYSTGYYWTLHMYLKENTRSLSHRSTRATYISPEIANTFILFPDTIPAFLHSRRTQHQRFHILYTNILTFTPHTIPKISNTLRKSMPMHMIMFMSIFISFLHEPWTWNVHKYRHRHGHGHKHGHGINIVIGMDLDTDMNMDRLRRADWHRWTQTQKYLKERKISHRISDCSDIWLVRNQNTRRCQYRV